MNSEHQIPTGQPISNLDSTANSSPKPQESLRPEEDELMGMEDIEMEDEYIDPNDAVEADPLDAMMDQYLDQMGEAEVNIGQMLTVPVVAVKTDGILVDLGEKSEGFVPIREFTLIDQKPTVKVGDMIDVVVRGTDPDSGLINLSYRDARRRKAWQESEDAFKNHKTLKGVVTRTVKGGLIMDIGTTAFLPASQIDLRRVEDFDQWIGREVEGYVIEFSPEKRRIIISRRQLLEEDRDKKRRTAMEAIEVGREMEVPVKRVVDFGAFVDLGGVDGLIPRSEISWQRNARPEDFMNVGETVLCRVIEVDPEKGKITLSRRAVLGDPWLNVKERYPQGAQVTGTVVSVTNYGAFVRLEEGMDGMIHISDMAWDSAGKKPNDFVTVGQTVTATVINIDEAGKRVSLGLKQLTEDPWGGVEDQFPKGSRVKGKVTGLTRYGAFVELGAGIEGMIHVSDLSWERRVNQPRDVIKKGDEVEACVLEVDRQRRRISLGIKQLTESPIARYTATHKAGDVIEGQVANVTEFGVFVMLEDGIEGFIHVSQLDQERDQKPSDVVKPGETITAKITKIDPETGKISLSRRQMIKDEERRSIAQYMKKKSSGGLMSMGELLEDIQLMDDLPEEPVKKEEPKAAPAPEAPAQSGSDLVSSHKQELGQLATPMPEPVLEDEAKKDSESAPDSL